MARVRALGIAGIVALAAAAGSAGLGASAPTTRLAVIGDWGFGTSAQRRVADRICAEHTRRPFDAIVTTGDNFYRPDGQANQANFDGPMACVLATGLPWHAAWGNHDIGGSATAERLRSPERWYQVDLAVGRLVVLDANRPSDPKQLAFMERALATAPGGPLVLSFHQPLHSGGLHRPSRSQRAAWQGILRRYPPDLVLQGHNHAYERLVVDGVTYIVSGGGGAPLYPCVLPATGLRRCVVAHHFLAVTLSRSRIAIVARRADGGVIEQTLITPRLRDGG